MDTTTQEMIKGLGKEQAKAAVRSQVKKARPKVQQSMVSSITSSRKFEMEKEKAAAEVKAQFLETFGGGTRGASEGTN